MLAAKKNDGNATIAEVWIAYRDSQPEGTWTVLVNPSPKQYRPHPRKPKAINQPPPPPQAQPAPQPVIAPVVLPAPAPVVQPKPIEARRPFVATFYEPERRKSKRQLIREGQSVKRYENE